MKKINKFLASFLVAVMILTAAPLTVFAETLSGTCGEGVAWSLDTEKGELIISGNGKMDDFYANSYSSPICNVPWYSVRDKVQSVLIKDGVTHIGTLAFYNCANLTEITFPDSVTSFGGSVFSGCYKLTSVDLPENLTEIGESVFSMSNITKITIPDSVTAIGDSAFSRCYDLAEITFGANVKSIGENAFSETGELENIYFTGTLGDWCEISFGNVNSNPWRYGEKLYVDGKLVSGDIIIPEGTEAINDYSIFSEGGITGITIPASVKRIGDGTLYSLSDLEKITVDELNTAYSSDESGALFDKSKAELMLFPAKSKCTEYTVPDGIVSIRASAFDACSGLVNVTLPESLTEIGNSAFLNCSALESIIIPGNVTSVGDYAFYYCKKLTDITIPASVNHFGQSAFSGTSSKKTVRYEGDIAGWCAINFDNYSAPIQYSGEILYIDGKCIEGELVIPEGVEKINDYAFRFCSAITSLTLPDSITEIGVRAFSNCSSLKNISFGKNIKTIGAAAFEDCRALTTLNIPDGISKIGGQSFSNCTALKDVTIGNGLTEVEGHLFYMCKNLQSVTLPETVTIIEQAAFCECNNLNSINLSENLKTIENTAFGDCFSLTEIKIPDSVTYLGEYAFYGCESLVEATIGDGITTIKSYTFENCQNLETLVLSDNVLRIDKYAFNNCTKLADIYYSGSQAEWDEIYIYGYNEPLNTAEIHFNHIVFDSKEGTCGDSLVWKLDGITGDLVISGTGKMTNYSSTSPAPWSDYCNQIYSITVKDGVTTIGDDTFNGCVNLKNVSLPASLTKIGNSAFRDCASLKEITIPDNVTSLGYYAFYGCTGFEAITVGNGVKTIGNHAFRMCSNLKTITLPVSLTSVSKNAFNECPSLSTVNYLGTSAQWAAVTIADSNDPLVNAKLICLGDTHKCTYGEWTVTVEPTATTDGEKVHTCIECGEAEAVTIPATGFEPAEGVTIDFATNTISGFNAGEASLDGYTTTVNDNYVWEYEAANGKLGTGSKAILKDGDTVIGEYTILVYGDTTGDSWYDGQDAIIVDCLANGMLTKDDVGEAVYMAADCNHDGVIDQLDVDLLNQAGTLLSNVDQSKPAEVLLETSSAYVEYLDLIDQTPEIEVEDETDAPEADEEDSEPIEENSIFTFISKFIAILQKLFRIIFGFVNV